MAAAVPARRADKAVGETRLIIMSHGWPWHIAAAHRPGGLLAPRRLKPTPGHRRSTSPGTGSAETSPRRTHARIPDRRLTASRCYKMKQVTTTIVYSSQHG